MDKEETRMAEIKVGAFVLAALLVLVIGSLWVAGSTLFRGKQTYWVRLRDSGGLQTGDWVRIAGVEVGRIRQVKLHPGKAWPVAIEVTLNRDIPIKTDSAARVATTGLYGLHFLRIEPGTPEAPPLPPGGEIQGQETLSFDEVLARVDQISIRAEKGIGQLTGFLDQTSREVQLLSNNMNRFLSKENAEQIHDILLTLQETLDQSGRHVSSILARLDSVLGPNGSRLARVLEEAEQLLASSGGTMTVIDSKRQELGAAMSDLRDAASNLKAFSQMIKERPFNLVRITPEPDRRPGQGRQEKGR